MLTFNEILQAIHPALGQPAGFKPSQRITGISIDSRQVKKGHLFVAIIGTRLDGHRFVKKAVERGACAVIVSRRVAVPKHVTVFVVSDTTKALGKLAAFYRNKFNVPIIAITGSAGKTTTKDLLAHVLSAKFKVLKSERSENNHIGVPLTLFKLKSAHEMAVVELGTNRFGDIPWIASIARPDIAIFTNIGDSHLQGLKNKAGVLKEKGSILKFMGKTGTVIYNADDAYLKRLKKQYSTKHFVGFSIHEKSRHQVKRIDFSHGLKGYFKAGSHHYQISIPSVSYVYNALAVIACAKMLKVPDKQINLKLKTFKSTKGRFEITRVNGVYLIDDTYNANPVSFDNALMTLDSLKIPGKKIVVCADMLELGKSSRKLHQALGARIAGSSAEAVFVYGREMKAMVEEIHRRNHSIRIVYNTNINILNKNIIKSVRKGDCLLVKGSRSMGLERIVHYLKQQL